MKTRFALRNREGIKASFNNQGMNGGYILEVIEESLKTAQKEQKYTKTERQDNEPHPTVTIDNNASNGFIHFWRVDTFLEVMHLEFKGFEKRV